MLSQTKVNELNALFGAELNVGTSAGRRSGKWECNVSEMFIGDYFIVPLTTTKMLKSEGYVMSNCCRNYKELCENLQYSIFSIRSRSGERLATLGLTKESGYWRLDQCFGPANAEVLEEISCYLDEEEVLQTEYHPTELYYVVQEVARLMNCSGRSH
ncbi:hypothetical protein SAMN02745220_04475 [Desulfopila aestuarii DSM 18488]|uniref:Uncharacterized protein n=2 Tax=Desulfopila aestuarii TaxID=231440 RepID=A0A1M7YI00_9BACT|nr:hypothetical protein SAMN02745220_04475 [Desulfopila aestuarii DSM 18488]